MHSTIAASKISASVGTSDNVSNRKLDDRDSFASFEFVAVVCTAVDIILSSMLD